MYSIVLGVFFVMLIRRLYQFYILNIISIYIKQMVQLFFFHFFKMSTTAFKKNEISEKKIEFFLLSTLVDGRAR